MRAFCWLSTSNTPLQEVMMQHTWMVSCQKGPTSHAYAMLTHGRCKHGRWGPFGRIPLTYQIQEAVMKSRLVNQSPSQSEECLWIWYQLFKSIVRSFITGFDPDEKSIPNIFKGCCSVALTQMDHSVYVSSQWEMALHCNTVSHWLAHTQNDPCTWLKDIRQG